MKLDPSMGDSELRKMFGLKIYEEERRLVKEGRVSPPEEAHPSIAIRSVLCDGGSSHEVLIRDYGNGKMLFDCDCGTDACSHIAAVLLSDSVPDDAEDCDGHTAEKISALIDRVAEDIVGDPDYDDEANYYDDWEIDKYDLENYNGDVEYEHVKDILNVILFDMDDPDASILLIDDLIRSLSRLEFDNGGADKAFSEHRSDISSAFERISPKTLARIMGNTTFDARMVFEPLMEALPRERLDEAYAYLGNDSRLCDKALDMQFERCDYDAYIRCSPDRFDAIVRTVVQLDRLGDDSASRYAGMLIGCGKRGYERKAADILSSHGYRNEAAELYLEIFDSSHRYEDLRSYRDNSGDADISPILDRLVSETLSRNEYDVPAMRTLVLNGRGTDVDDYILKRMFSPRMMYGRYDCSEIPALCSLLLSRGFVDSAAKMGRGMIKLRLDLKDPDNYQDAVEMLMYMDREKEFENAKESHSSFKSRLRTDYPKMRKFWGLYEGTWVDKKRSRSYW